MKVAALLSGGKDSCYNMMECVKNGHEIVCLVNIAPEDNTVNEMDSWMFQTIGHNAIEAIALAMELPLICYKTAGNSFDQGLHYSKHSGDEVEDLFEALVQAKNQFPDIEGVSSGAILSNYQRDRVENVCSRLNLISLAYLWNRNQTDLLNEMLENGIVAIVVKTATMGLDRRHIGHTLNDLQEYLLSIARQFGCNPCGEGGEYETFTLDCPLFKRRVVLDKTEINVLAEDDVAPVILLVPRLWHLENKK